MKQSGPVAPRPRLLRRETADAVIIEPEPCRSWTIGGDKLLASFFNQPPPLDFMIPGLLAGTVGLLYGPGSVGKSWIALQLAVAVAGGPDISGAFGTTSPGPVVYLGDEDPEIVITHRLHLLGSHLDLAARQSVAEHLTIQGFGGTPPDLLRDLTILNAAADGSRLVVIDTLRRFHTGDENDTLEMMLLLSGAEGVAARTGSTVLLLHHVSKSSQLNGTTGASAAKGSAVLTDHPRFAASLSPMSTSEADRLNVPENQRGWYVQFGITKCNFGPLPAPRWLKRGEGGVLLPADISEPQAGSGRRKSRRRSSDDDE